jgi:hypothetical protein
MKVFFFFLAFIAMIILIVSSFFIDDIIMSKLFIGISLILGLLIIKGFKLTGFDS